MEVKSYGAVELEDPVSHKTWVVHQVKLYLTKQI